MKELKGFNSLFISTEDNLVRDIERHLEQKKTYPHFRQVRSEEELKKSLGENGWDIIFFEYPNSFIKADDFLKLIKSNNLHIPSIIIGENTGEEEVAELIKKGFSNYIKKTNFERLESIIFNEIKINIRMKESIRHEILKRNLELSDIFARFAGGVSHNINNLLMVVLNNAIFIRDNPILTINLREDIDRIITSARKGEEFIKDLLSIASGNKLEPTILDVNSFSYKVADIIRGTMGPDIDVNLERISITKQIKVDEKLIIQAFQNIALNAKEAMRNSGVFNIKVEVVNLDEEDLLVSNGGLKPREYIKFTFSDNGIGIPEDIKPHIFEPFFSTKGKGMGYGLGLPVSYGIIKEHNGIIDFDSEPGKGSNFYVYIPVYTKDSQEIYRSEYTEHTKKRRGYILIVEDDLDVKMILSRIFIEEGYNTIEAIDGIGALVMLDKVKPDNLCAVVTDVIMPRMGGLELAKNVREKYKDVKVIFISGYPDNDCQILKFENSIFIQKPIAGEILMNKVREFLFGNKCEEKKE